MKPRYLYWNEDDRQDMEMRRSVNADRIYTEASLCDFCSVELAGAAFQCEKCNSLMCTSCAGEDGSCPTCADLGRSESPRHYEE
jgi:hypothetical protein